MNSRLTIVILNYLATQVTLDCLHSLAACQDLDGNGIKVIVWENGSGDEAVCRLKETIDDNRWHDWVELIVSSVNLGFTGGNNRVIEREMNGSETPRYFLLLNSDTLVGEGSISSLLDFMDAHPRVGIAGSRLLTKSGQHQCSPFRFPGIVSEFDKGLRLGMVSRMLSRWQVAMVPPDTESAVDWVSGASMMLRTAMLEQIGRLDEDFFTYFEDVDLCKRARNAGWEVWYVPQSRVVHLEGASSGMAGRIAKRRPGFWFQARRRYYLKHKGRLGAACADGVFIIGYSLWRLRRLLQGKPDADPPRMLTDFVSNSVFKAGFLLPKVNAPAGNFTDTQKQG